MNLLPYCLPCLLLAAPAPTTRDGPATAPATRPAVEDIEVQIIAPPNLAAEAEAFRAEVGRLYLWTFDALYDAGDADGVKPLRRIKVVVDPEYDGIARAGGHTVTYGAKWFAEHPADWATLVHELAHLVQKYPGGACPTWLSEGIADHVRFFQYEPQNRPHPGPDAKHTDSYRTTAAFLDWVQQKYDPDLVTTLNTEIRAGRYDADLWVVLTGRTLDELGQEWRETLQADAAK